MEIFVANESDECVDVNPGSCVGGEYSENELLEISSQDFIVSPDASGSLQLFENLEDSGVDASRKPTLAQRRARSGRADQGGYCLQRSVLGLRPK